MNSYEVSTIFTGIQEDLDVEPMVAAVLVLAAVIQEKHFFDRSSGENFGHELNLALKDLLANSSINLSEIRIDQG